MHAATGAPCLSAKGPAFSQTRGPETEFGLVSNELDQRLDAFLADVERRALRTAELATRNRADALDLVQDAMLRFVRSYAHKPAAQWPPLFHRVLQNRIIDWHRGSGLRARMAGWLARDGDADPMDELPDPRAQNPLHAVRNLRATEALDTALAQLPLRQRQAVLLRLWEGLDVAQTATAMGCSAGSVKTHLSRGLARLRELLGDHWQAGEV